MVVPVVVVVRISLHVSSQLCERTVDFLRGPSVFTVFGRGGSSFLNFLNFVSCVSWRCRQQTKQECCGCPTTRNRQAFITTSHSRRKRKKKTLEAQEFLLLSRAGEITPKQKRKKNIFSRLGTPKGELLRFNSP